MNDDARPDPDALLAQLRAEEQRSQRGKLRIYFGANAGVGKTWAMLSAAQISRIAWVTLSPRAGFSASLDEGKTHGDLGFARSVKASLISSTARSGSGTS